MRNLSIKSSFTIYPPMNSARRFIFDILVLLTGVSELQINYNKITEIQHNTIINIPY